MASHACYGGSVGAHETNVGAYGIRAHGEKGARSTHALPSLPTDGALRGLAWGLHSRAAGKSASNLRCLLGLMFANSIVL